MVKRTDDFDPEFAADFGVGPGCPRYTVFDPEDYDREDALTSSRPRTAFSQACRLMQVRGVDAVAVDDGKYGVCLTVRQVGGRYLVQHRMHDYWQMPECGFATRDETEVLLGRGTLEAGQRLGVKMKAAGDAALSDMLKAARSFGPTEVGGEEAY